MKDFFDQDFFKFKGKHKEYKMKFSAQAQFNHLNDDDSGNEAENATQHALQEQRIADFKEQMKKKRQALL
jgi:hypothetical protein